MESLPALFTHASLGDIDRREGRFAIHDLVEDNPGKTREVYIGEEHSGWRMKGMKSYAYHTRFLIDAADAAQLSKHVPTCFRPIWYILLP